MARGFEISRRWELCCLLFAFFGLFDGVSLRAQVSDSQTVQEAPQPDPARNMQQQVEEAIDRVLAPLPTEPAGQVPLANYQTDLMRLSEDIKDLQAHTRGAEKEYYGTLLHICGILTEAARERDTFIQRLNSNHTTTSKSSLVTAPSVGGTHRTHVNRVYSSPNGTYYYRPSSYSSYERRREQDRQNEAARQEDRDRRVQSHEASTLHQWKGNADKIRNMIALHYSRSRALLRTLSAPPQEKS